MAERMMIINSATIKGAGLYQCWPYGTTEELEGNLTAQAWANIAIEKIMYAELAGDIDPTSNLQNNSIYIMSGGASDTDIPANGPKA